MSVVLQETGRDRAARRLRAAWTSPTLMTWASLCIRLGGLTLLLPIVLRRLPASEVLVWQLLSTITLLVGWTDFGFSPTFARVVAFARGGGSLAALASSMKLPVQDGARPDPAALDVDQVLATQRTIYRRLIVCAALIAAVAGTAALRRPVAGLDQPSQGWLAWAFTFGSSLLLLANGANVSILTGFDQIADTRRREALFAALQLGATSLVAFAGAGLPVIVACYSLWPLPLYLLNRRQVATRVSAKTRRLKADPAIFNAIWPAAWRSGVGILMSAGIIQASGLIYAQIAPVTTAAAYLLALRAMSALSQIAQAPFYSRLPQMAAARGRGRDDEVVRLAGRGMSMAHWTYVAGACALLLAAPPLLKLLGSSVRLPPYPMLALLVGAFFVERYGAMHIQLYSLTNHIIWHIVNGVTGALMIALVLIGYQSIGPYALPLAMLLAYAMFLAPYASTLSLRSVKERRAPFERATALWPAMALLAVLAAGFLLTTVFPGMS